MVKERGTAPCKVVTQHVISLTYVEELLRRFIVIWIDIGMVEFGQLKTGFVQQM